MDQNSHIIKHIVWYNWKIQNEGNENNFKMCAIYFNSNNEIQAKVVIKEIKIYDVVRKLILMSCQADGSSNIHTRFTWKEWKERMKSQKYK